MQILAIGGAGFSMEPDKLALERYALSLTGQDRPRVCFIPTASGESPELIARVSAALDTLPCEYTVLSLFTPNSKNLREFVCSHDLLYVGGGNTKSMLCLWREWGIDQAIKDAAENGAVLAGVSAGMICWFEQGVTDSIPGELNPLPCLGFLPGSACPHYDSEPQRRPVFTRLVSDGVMPPGYAADDGAALHFRDGKLVRCVASRPAAEAFWIGKDKEEPLPTDRLPT